MNNIKKIGIIGGSGSLGSALTNRLIQESFKVTIGSRSPEKVISKFGEIDKDLDLQNLKVQGIGQTARPEGQTLAGQMGSDQRGFSVSRFHLPKRWKTAC